MNPIKQAGQVRLGSPMLAGLAYGFITMAVAALAASLILISGDQGEEVLPAYAYAIHGLSVLIGSFVTGRRSGSKGWYYGGLLGLVYSIIVLIVGFLSFDRGADWTLLFFAAGAFLAGALGGIMGVNTRR
ncbi:TIGR04086 family membrane protein [Gorillibacterium sp. sgz5001074]|uniref:TIGR04086 family membrane protein n=1 Tax=Gorillibacterium sp. sgz5001074 TaxID=3446695 RepID=UPI003F680EDC